MRYLVLLATLVTACRSPEATIGEGWRPVVNTPPEPIEALDILFIVDTSQSMATDQWALVQSAGDQLFAQLEADLGGMPDLHVGVTSTDLGAGNYSITGCEDGGENGRLLLGPPDAPPCPDIADNFLVDLDDGAGGRIRNYQGALADNFACMARLGTNGCGFEQPLEAMVRALDGSNPENAGFLRQDALLLVVVLADEDDCSAFDPGLFDPSDDSPDGLLGPLRSFRCFEFGVVCDPDDPRTPGAKDGCVSREDSAYVRPLQEYVDFLTALKPDPSLVMLAGIVPPPGPVAVDAVDPEGWDLAGVCIPPPAPCAPEQPECERQAVQPAVRLDAIIKAFPARYAFEPICGDTMSVMLNRIARTATGIMAAETCLLGDTPPAMATCRAFDVVGDTRTAIPACTPGDRDTCFTIVEDAARCSYAPSGLRADVQRATPAPAGSRFVLECLGG